MEDEFSFIDSIKPKKIHQSRLRLGIGDDAAVYESEPGYEEVVCIDTIVEGVHFRRDTLSPKQIGWKALAINVSDLAAMGAIPQFYLVAIAVPPTWTEGELRELYDGMGELAHKFAMDLIGGDTSSAAHSLMVTVTAIGVVEAGGAVKRGASRQGDVVFLTGPVGGSAAGFSLLDRKTRHGIFTAEEKSYVLRHQEVVPQVALGRLCVTSNGRVALNDVSDGVSSEAYEIAIASGVQIVLTKQAMIDLSPQLQSVDEAKRLEWSLCGGEDFALLGTTSTNHFTYLQEKARDIGRKFYPIGFVRAGTPAVYMANEDGEVRLGKKGYNHFNDGENDDDKKI